MSEPSESRSLSELLSTLVGDLTDLLRKESHLIRAELSEKAHQLQRGLGVVVVGGVLLAAALVILLQAFVVALVNLGLQPGWAGLIVGGGAAVLGIILFLKGVGATKPSNLMPERSTRQVQQDARLIKDQVR